MNGKADYKTPMTLEEVKDVRKIAREITNAENGADQSDSQKIDSQQSKQFLYLELPEQAVQVKSSVTDEIVRRFLNQFYR